jgi:adenylylsulfate kinase
MNFAIWITGLPASGKSTITAALRPRLERAGLRVEVLESDVVRQVLTPSMAFAGSRLVANGVTVIFDATATKRAYREYARQLIARFIEVAVECPLDVCMVRDKKGTYRKGLAGQSKTVPGLDSPYEASVDPDVRIDSEHMTAESAVESILTVLRDRGFVSAAA